MPMVLWLSADVFTHRPHVHGADTEFAIPGLPREIVIPRILRLQPRRRCGLNLLHNFCGRMFFGLGKQNVNMIAQGIGFDER